MRIAVIAKHRGQIALLLALVYLVPFGMAVASGDDALAARYLMVCAVFSIVATPAFRLPSREHIQINAAWVVVVLGPSSHPP